MKFTDVSWVSVIQGGDGRRSEHRRRPSSAASCGDWPSGVVAPLPRSMSFAPQAGTRKMDAVEYFEIDPQCLTLQHLLTNEGGLGEVWVGELHEGGMTHKVAVKKYPSAFAEQEIEMFRRETSV